MVDNSPRQTAIYARLSVDRDGKKVGIDTQLQDSRKLAKERGWVVVDEYVDRNLTAADKLVHRPEYERLVSDFEAGRYSALVCWDLDRLTRQPRQLEDWIDAAESREVALITANGEADLATDGGRLYARLKVAVAKGETERASARQKPSKQARRENGQWHGGTPPYGYRAKDGQLVPEASEVKRIAEATRRLLDDREPMHSIIADWNRKGIPTRSGKHWRQTNLRSILMNRSMLGETKAGVVGWDPVIDRRNFDRLQALLTDPSRKITHSPGVKGGKYTMGGGLTVCAKCGKPLVSNSRVRGNGERLIVLECLRRVQGPSKHHPQVERDVTIKGEQRKMLQDTGRVSIGHDLLEEYVFGQAIDRLNATERWQQRMAESDPAIDVAIDALEAERATLRDQRERAGKAFVLGVMSDREAQREVERIDVELESIERKISDLLGRPVISKALEHGIDWRDWAPGRRRAFLRLLVDRVEIEEWPQGQPRTFPQGRNEPDSAYAERKRANMEIGVRKRVRIMWLDED